jgi:hypothetical protein
MFGVTAKLIGTGAARWLMNRALELTWAQDSARNGLQNVERVWLHTCTFDHPAALPFYRRAAFAPFRRQIVVGDDPRLNGIAPGDAAPQIPIIA